MTSLTLVRRIAARPSVVFDLIATPEGLAAWWGPDDLPVVKAEIDPRIGGGYRVHFHSRDGGDHEAFGEVLELEPPERLVMAYGYAFGGEPEEAGFTSRIAFELRPIEGGTELTFTHVDLRNEASKASHARGWTGALDKLAARFARGADADRV